MHYFVRLCFNNSKNTTLKNTKKFLKIQETLKTGLKIFFIKNILKTFLHLWAAR